MPSLNRIFLINVAVLIVVNLLLFFLMTYLIKIDLESFQTVDELRSLIEGKCMLLFFIMSILYTLITQKLASNITGEIDKIAQYLESIDEKSYKTKIKLRYSREFYQIGKRLSKSFKRLDKLNKRKRKFNAKLKVINYQQEKLLGAISHELKNPMSSIMGYAQILRDELNSNERDNVYVRFAEKIITNSKRVDELLNRLRLAVQLENNKFELKYRVFDISASIERTIINLDSTWRDRSVRSNLKPYELYADKTLIELVLVNLIENGLKYSAGEILIELNGDCLRVTDYGIGIEEAKLSSVTKRFYRVDNNSYQQSMGLGLAIVSYILKLHNLKLEIKSEVGKGSTFSINLLPIKNRELPKEIETFNIID